MPMLKIMIVTGRSYVDMLYCPLAVQSAVRAQLIWYRMDEVISDYDFAIFNGF